MPLICIGPVCIPMTALIPLVVWLARPIWVRLPPAYQQAFLTRYAAFQAYVQANVYDRIGWKAKAKPAADKAADGGAGAADKLLAARGGVLGVHTDEEWKAAVELTSSAGISLVVDFTAVWCGPCQRIAPDFAKLAAKHKETLFIKVDVDELEDVMSEAGVVAMPTFQLYQKGKLAEAITGANLDKLTALVEKA